MVAKSKPNEISITRVYDAPVDAVWDAWTDPEQVGQWWGPRGFTITTHSKDLQPGGIWHYTMHGPDGTDYPNKTLYHVVDQHKKLVYDHGGNDERKPMFRVTVLFSELNGKTTMEMTMALPTAEEAAATRKFIKAAGGNATWDRLAEFLKDGKGQPSFIITRSFAAPIEQMFELWTNPNHFSQWLPPVGFEMDILSGEIQAGQDCFFRMSDRAELTFYGKFEFHEIIKPDNIVYVQRFCDAEGNITRHPGLPVFPESMLNTIHFAAEDDVTTRITVTTIPFGTNTTEETTAFKDLRSSMTQGWTGSLDKLEAMVQPAAEVL
jgi:uncharacterized protein YndB with AHSA1/START domain